MHDRIAERARNGETFSAWPGAPRKTPLSPEEMRRCTRPVNGSPLLASARPELAIERLVFRIGHFTLWPLRLLSGFVSRARRRNGTAA